MTIKQKKLSRARQSYRLLAVLCGFVLVLSACSSGDGDATDSSGPDSSDTPETSESSDSDTSQEPSSEGGTTGEAQEFAALFVDGALTEDATVVPCTLSNGSESTCYQVQVSSLPDTVNTEGPYCPETVEGVGGIWVWDGEDPGLYNLNSEFWEKMDAEGFEFTDGEGNISITNPGSQSATASDTENSCLEATPDGSYHLQVLLPTAPEDLDEPTDLSTISQVGLSLDGVTIFGDAPSVADRGGLPALDACGGHIDPSGYYHWHFGAESIQTNLDEIDAELTCDIEQDVEALAGFAHDGYAIYAPEENGEVPTDVDECNGHVGETAEFGEVYHYHLSYESPNLPPCRKGATAQLTLSSPDNDNVALPNGEGRGDPGGGQGGRGGPPPQ